MYLSGEVDYAEIGANLLSPMLSSYSDQIHPSRPDVSYSYWYLFNFDPGFDEEYEPDNWKIAVNNENFRLSIMHGLDRVNAMQVYDSANPEGLLNNTITRCRLPPLRRTTPTTAAWTSTPTARPSTPSWRLNTRKRPWPS